MVILGALAGTSYWLNNRDGATPAGPATGPPTVGPPATSPPATTPPATSPPPGTPTPPTSPPATGSPAQSTPASPPVATGTRGLDRQLTWVGLEYRGDRDPVPERNISQVSGALLADGEHEVSVVTTPDGYQYWSLELIAYDGDIPWWRVVDAISMRADPYDDYVVLGTTACSVDGRDRTGVVGAFADADAGQLTRMIEGYTIDPGTGRFGPLAGVATCTNEAFGV